MSNDNPKAWEIDLTAAPAESAIEPLLNRLERFAPLCLVEIQQLRNMARRSDAMQAALASPAPEQPTGTLLEAALESIPVGARLTTDCPCCKQQVLSQDIEPFAEKCKGCKVAVLERKVEAAKVLRERLVYDPSTMVFARYVISYSAVADFDRDFAPPTVPRKSEAIEMSGSSCEIINCTFQVDAAAPPVDSFSTMSQVQVIGLPTPKSWDDYESGCLSTFSGGHRGEHAEAFRHGMQTVFNLLRAEFPSAQQCKAAIPAAELQKLREENERLRTAFEKAVDDLRDFHGGPNIREDCPRCKAVVEARSALAEQKGGTE